MRIYINAAQLRRTRGWPDATVFLFKLNGSFWRRMTNKSQIGAVSQKHRKFPSSADDKDKWRIL